jgi:nucleoside-diphosphate-sugar epimerase
MSNQTTELTGAPRRVLVTGGSGFVGASLVRRLISDGHDVHLLLSPNKSAWRLDGIAGHYESHHVDLRDTARIQTLVAELRPQWLFHLATYGAYPHQDQFDQALATNVVATIGLVRAAIHEGFESFVLAGSSSEYGAKDHPPEEDEGLNPASYYAATKAAATVLSRQLAAASSANLMTLRLYSVYGPFEEPTRLVPAVVASSWSNQLPPLVNPESAHDFVFVDDVVEAFIRCARQTDHLPGAVYNVSTGTQLTLRDVVDTARAVLNVTAEPVWGSMPSRSWDTSNWQGTSRSIQSKTGWQATHSFASGLRKTADWFDSEPQMKGRYLAARGMSTV